jgi:hypothetical protein
MRKVTLYKDYIVENTTIVNEGIFDTLKSIFFKITSMFDDSVKLNSQIDVASAKAGVSDDLVNAKTVKAGVTMLVRLQSKPDGPDNTSKRVILSFTKLADLPDSSGLFQITGCDSTEFLQSLGMKTIEELNKIGVLAILTDFKKETPLTMRVYRNVGKDGKPVVTESLIQSTLSADVIQREKPQ